MHPCMGPRNPAAQHRRLERRPNRAADRRGRRRHGPCAGDRVGHAQHGRDGELHCLGGSEGGDDDDERSPRRKLSSFAIAALGWQPDQFWRATPHEFWTAVEGYERLNRAAQP
ncbi:phage tail assembly chaperone [Novosphingobium sp. EMRT-2]|nr:phage tail assembly chaperone [Novosphingobium sp. EMRT-2]